jgi:hypothetical protein
MAAFLLTFDPDESVLAEQVTTPSGVPVEPEMTFVPLDPVLPAPPAIDGLRVDGGAYLREYRACYLRGVPVGACAVAVNPSALVPAVFPHRDAYRRTLQIGGRGVVEGIDDGTISYGGAPAPLIAPRGWVIALH